MMPQMDGLTLAYLVRADFPSIPVLLVSGYAETERVKVPEGTFEFLQKPFLPATFLRTVKKVMSPKPPSTSLREP
jgi:CheY-like chemotaxis protein